MAQGGPKMAPKDGGSGSAIPFLMDQKAGHRPGGAEQCWAGKRLRGKLADRQAWRKAPERPRIAQDGPSMVRSWGSWEVMGDP